ncbi:hypothetical protein K488DRAFT_67507 [Vararia minispora EC-137]|uniref:Uncharacterized protein n=1 Tax=Vararia minispora EC-137 TaxID=1314806 RepID=A0ACB8QZI1_9AGAM|nr:hypothetical protein K488DRAFT_67507 [Vararia minispora EC-137]
MSQNRGRTEKQNFEMPLTALPSWPRLWRRTASLHDEYRIAQASETPDYGTKKKREAATPSRVLSGKKLLKNVVRNRQRLSSPTTPASTWYTSGRRELFEVSIGSSTIVIAYAGRAVWSWRCHPAITDEGSVKARFFQADILPLLIQLLTEADDTFRIMRGVIEAERHKGQ